MLRTPALENFPSHSLCPFAEPRLLDAHQVPGTVLGTQDASVSKTD